MSTLLRSAVRSSAAVRHALRPHTATHTATTAPTVRCLLPLASAHARSFTSASRNSNSNSSRPVVHTAARPFATAAPGFKELADDDFDTHVLQAQEPVIVQFHATWCGPCKKYAPVLESAVKANGKVKLVKVDVDDCPAISSDMKISAVPTIMAFHKGKPVKTFTGALSSADTAAFVSQLAALQ